MSLLYKNRDCLARPSKKNPDAWTKDQLVKEAEGLFDASGMNKEEICKNLLRIQKRGKETITIKKGKSLKKKEKPQEKRGRSRSRSPSPSKEKSKKEKKKRSSPSQSPQRSRSRSRSLSPKGNCIERSKLKPKPHQLALINFLKTNRGAIVAHPTGSGKTLTAVIVSQCFLDENEKNKVIVIAQSKVIPNFKKELKAYGSKTLKRYKFYTFQKFGIDHKAGLIKCDNTLLIVDEAHELRTPVTQKTTSGVQRAKEVVQCGSKSSKVLLLTATPVYNNPYDIVNLVALIKGEKKPLSKKQFETIMDDENSDLFNTYFQCMFSFHDEVRDPKDFPSSKSHYPNVVMTEKYQKQYNKIEANKDTLFNIKNPFAFLTGVRKATNIIADNPKVKKAMKIIDKGQQTILYSAFKSAGVELIEMLLKKKGIKFGKITGDVSSDDVTKLINKYNNGKIQVLLITKAGGQGLDLKGTRNVILLESQWNDTGEAQVIGRAVRYKSHSHLPKDQQHVDIYHLILKKDQNPTIDYGIRESADEILHELKQKKTKELEKFLKKIKNISLENYSPCNKTGYKIPKTPYIPEKKTRGYKKSGIVKPVATKPERIWDEKKGYWKVIGPKGRYVKESTSSKPKRKIIQRTAKRN